MKSLRIKSRIFSTYRIQKFDLINNKLMSSTAFALLNFFFKIPSLSRRFRIKVCVSFKLAKCAALHNSRGVLKRFCCDGFCTGCCCCWTDSWVVVVVETLRECEDTDVCKLSHLVLVNELFDPLALAWTCFFN